jgi:plastocyanin
MRFSRWLLLAVAASWSIACGGGGDDDGGTNPNPTQVLGSIVPSVTTLSINAGQSSTISVTARDANGATIAGASGYTYTSSAPAIAAVSTSGSVTGLSAGSATITVSLILNGVTKTATVAVTVAGSLPTTVTVIAGANSNDFTPAFVAIARAGTVTWTFGARVHNVEFGNTGGAPANVPNTSNASVSRTFNAAGTFAYTCTLHANQNGTVLVP